MDIENIENTEEINDGIIICNITYSDKSHGRTYGKREKEQLPTTLTADLPVDIKKLEEKNKQMFYDAVEQFSYNFVTKRFGYEVAHCQVYLP